jgi:integrase
MPKTWEDFDVAAAQFLEHVFSEGYPKGYGSDGLAALQHFVPEVAGKLRHSWRLLKSWQKMEPPVRVLPISPLMVVAISGACARLGYVSAAAAFLVAFDALLRPGELYALQKQHVTWARGKAILSLHGTKTGQRKAATEMVVCHSHVTNVWLWLALKNKKPKDKLLDCSPADLRHLFPHHNSTPSSCWPLFFVQLPAWWRHVAFHLRAEHGGHTFAWAMGFNHHSPHLLARCSCHAQSPPNF